MQRSAQTPLATRVSYTNNTYLSRSDSKPVHSTCRGYNINGLPCRKSIGGARVRPFCHVHSHQDPAGVTEKVSIRGPREPMSQSDMPPVTQGLVPKSQSMPHFTRSISQIPSDMHRQQPNSRSVQTGYGAVPIYNKSSMTKSTSRFSLKTMLRALGCIPTAPPVELNAEKAHHANVLPAIPRSETAPILGSQSLSTSSPVGATFSIKRKPVDYSSLSDTSLAELRQAKIRQNHAEIQALFGASEAGNVNTEVPQTPHLDQTIQNLVAKYLPRADYPLMQVANLAKMQKAIADAVIKASMRTSPPDPEYIYVFREDGDYQWTEHMTLKIGRSKDVQARLRQWYNQCRHRNEVLEQITTVDAVLVERMVHLEFDNDRVLRQCQCGRTHREWFQIKRLGAKTSIQRALTKWNALANEIEELFPQSI